MCPYAFNGGISKLDVYQASGSALANRGYSTAVAGRVDVAVSTRAAAGAAMSISASGMSHILTALTNQGYTSTRAAKLDKLDTSVSSRAKTGAAMALSASAITRIQTALTNQGFTTARGTKLDKLDTSVSSRAAVGAAMSINASGMSHIQTAITNLGYNAARAVKLDELDTSVSSRAKLGDAMSINASGISHIRTAMTNQGYTTTRAGYLDNIIKDIEDAVGSLTMNGTELTVKEFTALTQRMDAYIDLANMTSGDTIVLKQYMKIKSGGTYRLFGTETYTGGQTAPLTYLELKPAKYGFKITLQQSGGTNRVVDWQTMKQVKSG